ncbi:MAG: transposase [Bacteroidales bacterium]|nr:transposase [Bacteroidales bacterium]
MSKNTYTITRKIQLIPVGDKEEVNRVYTYLRDGMKAQNMALNQYISALYFAMQNDATKDSRKELRNLFSRISTSKKGSAYDDTIEFAKGLPSCMMTRKVESDFKNAMKKGLKYGKLSLPTYRDTNPLLIHIDYVRLRSTNPHLDNGLYHNYKNHTEFLEHLYDENLELFIKFANKITFKIILGNPHKSSELRSVFKNIFEDCYHIQGSSIEIEKNKIILNMSMSIPVKKIELDENIVVGVDLGMAIPAVCALNTNEYIHKSLGNYNDFIRERTKIQAQKKRMQKSLTYTNGGHGRKKKLKPLNRFKERERNWVKTYNHKISKQIIDFAIKNKAKYINLEDLSGIAKEDKDKFVLRNWSYFELQQFITYKAEKYGIIVRKIKPEYTSQKCSCCGHLEENQRINQSEFICKNPNCKNFGKIVNADYNGARNIAMSTNFVEEKETKSKPKKVA